jgi:hypothetical protein
MAESSSSLSYGLVVHLQLLSTPFRKDAVTFGYNDQIIIGKDFHLSDSVRSKAHRPTASLAPQRSPHRLRPVLPRHPLHQFRAGHAERGFVRAGVDAARLAADDVAAEVARGGFLLYDGNLLF